MTDEQVNQLWEAAKKNVKVSCDENHVHSASQGCLSARAKGFEDDVIICALAETILHERKLVRQTAEKLGLIPADIYENRK